MYAQQTPELYRSRKDALDVDCDNAPLGKVCLLTQAAELGDTVAIRTHIAAGANVNGKNTAKGAPFWTPLHVASSLGHAAAVEVLLSAGASIHITDESGKTPLYYAAKNGHSDVLRKLTEAGAGDEMARDVAGTALHEAVKNGHAEAAHVLLKAGADIDALNSYGWSLLHVACSTSCVGRDKNLLDVLLQAGAKPEQFIKYSSLKGAIVHQATPLMVAAMSNKHHEVAVLLAATGVSRETTDPDFGRTALHCAVSSCDVAAAEVLLANGARVAACDSAGRSPMHFLGHPHYRILNNKHDLEALGSLFLKHNGDSNVTDCRGCTPLHTIIENYDINSGADLGSKFKVLARVVHFMLSTPNFQINAYDKKRNNILHYLVELYARIAGQFNSLLGPGTEDHKQFMAIFHTLINAGANVRFRNIQGYTPAQLLYNRRLTKLPEAEVLNKFAPLFVALVAAPGGDRSWDSVPMPCPGIGEALYPVWCTNFDELPYLFARLEEPLKPVARTALLYLHRCLPGFKGLQMQILSFAL